VLTYGRLNETAEHFCLWAKVYQLFSLNRGGIGVDQLLFQFLISRSVAKIFVVESKIVWNRAQYWLWVGI